MNFQPLSHRAKLLLLIAVGLTYAFTVLIHLGRIPLNGDEPRRAVVTIEMLRSGNFIRPTTMGWEYFNKPPVYNWMMGICMYLTHSNSEIPVRLPSLIFILIWGFVHYQLAKKFVSKFIAAASAVFLVTSIDIYFWGLANGGEIDIFYSFIVYMQVMLMFYYNQRKNWLMLFLSSYFFCTIGFLTKGFPSVVFEVLTLAALATFNRSLKVIFRWQHLVGIICFIGLLGIYLYSFGLYSSPRILLTNLLKESFDKSAFGDYQDRFISKSLVYPFSFLKILLPWSLILLFLIRKRDFKLWSDPLLRFAILFILFNIPIYWFTGHPRMRYAYMFLPFAMLLLASMYQQFRAQYPDLTARIMRSLIWLFIPVLLLLISIPFWTTVAPALLIVSIAAVLLYLLFYKKFRAAHIWYFAAGIVVMRLVFALVYLPVKYEKTELKYDQEMATIAKLNNYGPVTFFKPIEVVHLDLDLKLTKLHFGELKTVPYLVYQLPYYYLRSSQKLVLYDSIVKPGQSYIGLKSTLKDINASIIYSFPDKGQFDSVVFFRSPSIP